MQLISLFEAGRKRLARIAMATAVTLGLLGSMTVPSFAAGGQFGSVSGTVVDATTRAPLAGATVSVAAPTGSFTTRTDARGYFSILGLPVDTYTVAIQASGYESYVLSAVTIGGDQQVSLGVLGASKTIKDIGRIRARPQTSAYQPGQTTDSYAVDVVQAAGKEASTNENNLLLSVPGVTLSNGGIPSIRGGGAREIGYQYDGVPFTEPFLANNGSNGLVSGIGSIQVVEGAGDASQGNVGTGVVNIIPKRGTYPSFGFIDAEVGGVNYAHQFAAEYGFAARDGAWSDYIAYTGDRYAPTPNGFPFNQTAGPYNLYFGNSYVSQNQWVNNFVTKFGKDKTQSLQVLYTNISSISLGNYGGNPGQYSESNPNGLAYYPYDNLSQSEYYGLTGFTPAQYAQLIGLTPGTPATNSPIPGPQQNAALQTRLLKFEYDNTLNSATFLALRYYNWEQLAYGDNSYSLGPGSGGIVAQQEIGGPTTGVSADLTHEFGSNLTVSVNAKYDVLHPIWNAYEPQVGFFGLNQFDDAATQPVPADWLPGGYIYNYFKGAPPRIPTWGINYQGSFFQNWGTGIRFLWTPTAAVNVDAGVRIEGQDDHWYNQLDQYGQGIPAGTPGGPYSVLPSAWTNAFLKPSETEPRIAVSWKLNSTNAIRAGYGRSAVFINGQTGGTPFNLYGLNPYLNIPAKPGATCVAAISGNNVPCTTYAQQLYWQGDNVEAPDAGNTEPALYNNYDLSYQHLFRGGIGARIVGFYKTGTNLPAAGLIELLPGGGAIFGTDNKGFNRTTGVEFNVTTPSKNLGLEGFFSATYQNVLGTTPPLSDNETNVPLLPAASIALGNIYRAGYVSPFSIRTGITYKLKGGFSIAPILQYDIGYPYSAGNLIASQCGNLANGSPNYVNIPQNNFGCGSPQINNGIYSTSGTLISTSYYDPAYPGTNLNPNIAATRGVNQTAATGGYLSHQNLKAGLTLQAKSGANTFGIQLVNLFGNSFIGSVPAVNPYYQPVATGLSGPQTSVNPNCVSQAAGGYGTARGCSNIPTTSYAFTNGAYVLSNGNFTAGPSIAPLQPFGFNVYYQRSL